MPKARFLKRLSGGQGAAWTAFLAGLGALKSLFSVSEKAIQALRQGFQGPDVFGANPIFTREAFHPGTQFGTTN
ncbi:hypothetical protein [Aliiruegeria sabulilitoris]|uniref:hypothetical protein n=1 Tax=Aliiruegeria sabulilitoris TaxID=1510458 RepID=UPI0012E3E02E|nr:hypothetical protein [Aliiruegeria sabulilitoris]NDR59101.1 hypothetical protein [Pseudoruegeria sp. M32A2M]